MITHMRKTGRHFTVNMTTESDDGSQARDLLHDALLWAQNAAYCRGFKVESFGIVEGVTRNIETDDSIAAKCDRCGATYSDEESIVTVRTGLAGGYAPCPWFNCTGQMELTENAEKKR